MSGHSKWATIKHKKAAADAKRGKIFTRLIREITVAAREGGGNPESNPRLRLCIQTAKDNNMPSENIERAIKKGTGELPGVSYEESNYEGYGPEGIAIFVHCLTDNKNRTSAEIRNIFTKNGGNMAGAGSVAWLFEKKGLFVLDTSQASEEKLMELVLEAGAEDLATEGDSYEVTCKPHDFENVRKALSEKGLQCKSGEITMLPKSLVKVAPGKAKSLLALIDAFEEHDDVQNVYTNIDIPDEIMKEVV